MTKKAEVAASSENRPVKSWKCPDCGTELNGKQMELQPKICTSCGEGQLEPVYDNPS
jgi:rubrerythrin